MIVCISACVYIFMRVCVYANAGTGIELLNEPAADLEHKHHNDLLDYYKQAYTIIRKYSPSCMVVVSILWDDYYGNWTNELLEPEYYNVVLDWYVSSVSLTD